MSKNVISYSEETISKQKYPILSGVSGWVFFGVILLVYLFFAWVSQEFIYSDSLYYRSYSGTMTSQAIERILGFQSRFWWTAYAFTPILLLSKFLFASICISIGAMLSKFELKFKEIFKTAMLAEGVFILAQAIFMASLYINLNDLTLQNISGYFPLSALSFIGIENANVQWIIYPLQTANLFEVAYMVVIGWLLSKQWKQDFVESLAVVVPSYVTGLLLWLVFVTFISLQVS